MPRRYLPAFGFEQAVSPEAARQDKIEINVGLGSIAGTDHEQTAQTVRSFLYFLGSPPQDHAGAEQYGHIFNRLQEVRGRFRNQPIRRRCTTTQPHSPPLFGGHLGIRNPNNQEPFWSFDVLLSLNPTRFLRHQEISRPSRQLLLEHPPFQYSFYQREIPLRHDDEFALIEDDNWIPDERMWQLFAGNRFWNRHLERHICGSVSEVLSEITRTAGQTGVNIEPPLRNRFSLWSVENYWEFYSEDPLGTVLSLEPLLGTFAASHVDSRDYGITAAVSEHNSRCLRLQLPRGGTLRIYAKTNRRIRFEVQQLLGELRLEGGHTTPTIEGLLPILSRTAEAAAGHVNAVMRHFRLNASVPGEQRTVFAFLMEFQAACRNPDTAHQLLQILVANGSLVVGPGIALGQVFGDELRRLKRAGILRVSHRRYSVTAPYTQALQNMRERGIGFLLGVRIRRRNR